MSFIMDFLDLCRIIGTFVKPNGLETLEVWRNWFKKTTAWNEIPKERWYRILLDLLKGKSKVRCTWMLKSWR